MHMEIKLTDRGMLYLAVTVMFATVFLANVAIAKIDAKRDAAWDAYTDCVLEEYGVPPAVWYSQTGEVPDCNY